MPRFRIALLLLISIIAILHSCSPIKGLKKSPSPEEISINLPLLENAYSTALYKTSISIGKHYHTGIFLFKKNLEEDATNIVFLSEFGLNLLEMKYKNDNIELINSQKFLKNKIFISNLKSCILPLLINRNSERTNKLYTDNNDSIKVIKIRHNSNRYYYFCNENNFVNKIVNQRVLKGDITIKLNYDLNKVPQNMVFINDRVKLELEMDLIKLN